MALTSLLISSCLLFLAASPALASNSEGEALCAFKSRLSDPNNVLQSWDQSLVNPCTWFHVTCDSQNRVIRLDLGNSNITGALGPELGRLQNLQYLELYRNNFVGKIPEELGNLKSLVSMDLYENQLEGEIPKSLSKLKSLRFMRLNNNKITGSIPRELVKLSNLKVLDFSNNDLCGTIPVDGPFSTFPPERYELLTICTTGALTLYIFTILSNISLYIFSFENNKRLNGPELLGLASYDFGC
ncbi:hypothetical protein LUZ61_006542 [Rhynchospora tenuis]|uniref:Leucine-rich repeat-containing N-terminal plant-type domain-containing protein n=1 Tax=Rhynchospora tenuis TaxID=198213 RepID=A0AAD6EVL4_9POAL|nr:hypothetical protein LUZ61_006542 [Rhynchospora tenuis]